MSWTNGIEVSLIPKPGYWPTTRELRPEYAAMLKQSRKSSCMKCGSMMEDCTCPDREERLKNISEKVIMTAKVDPGMRN